MPYPVIDDLAARAWWREWNARANAGEVPQRHPPPDRPAPGEEEGGDRHDWHPIAERAIAELMRLLETSDGSAAFEAEACVLLHRSLPPDPALADPGFWAWFAIVPGLDLVLARYAATAARPIPDLKNFSTASGKETLFFRLWVRAELAHDPYGEDPYELARYGDVDFWRSHVFRQMFSGYRELLAAFIRFQFPEGPGGSPRLTGKNQWELRELVKYLRRAFANIEVELMDRDRAFAFIAGEWRKIETQRGSA